MANLQLIKTLAEKQNITIESLAEQIGLSVQQVHLIVRKNSTKIETLEKIANVLAVPVSVFFDENVVVKTTRNENKGHHNAFAPEGTANIYDGMEASILKDLIKTKDELITELRRRISELENK